MSASIPSDRARTHWIMQRLSALVSWPLIVYIFVRMHHLWGASLDVLRESMAHFDLCIPLGCVTLTLIGHAVLGFQVVVEDYAPRSWHKPVTITFKIWAWLLSLLVIWSLGSIAYPSEDALRGLLG